MPVWQKASTLLIEVYRITDEFPDSEKFGLTSDMRRSVNSIVHNIAEGFGRFENKDKSRFYKISRGSAYELISQAHTAFSLTFMTFQNKESTIAKSKEIIEELDKLIKTVESRKQPSQ